MYRLTQIRPLKNLQKQKWNTAETLDSVVALEDHRNVLEQLMGVVSLQVYNPKTKQMETIPRHKSEKESQEIIDYAKNENFGNSLKSIKKQKIINPLKEIGNSDISTHVNFNLIKKTSTKFNLNSHGPVSQRKFLIELGILYRAEILIKNANNKQ